MKDGGVMFKRNWPKLVRFPTTPASCIFKGEPNEYGERSVARWHGSCNYQSKEKTVFTADKIAVKTTATLLFDGEIAHDIPVVTGGEVTVYGVTSKIVSFQRCRNPDGSVNYTKVEVE